MKTGGLYRAQKPKTTASANAINNLAITSAIKLGAARYFNAKNVHVDMR